LIGCSLTIICTAGHESTSSQLGVNSGSPSTDILGILTCGGPSGSAWADLSMTRGRRSQLKLFQFLGKRLCITFSVVQVLYLRSAPEHCLPPFSGFGLSHLRAANRTPVELSLLTPPSSELRQAEEQSVNGLHFPQAPSRAFKVE